MARDRIGSYDILETLGKGGMGVVYRARPAAGGADVALKTMPAPTHRHLAGLRREIHALARIRHPGVVRILEEGIADGVPWFAMELVAGEPLGRFVARRARRPADGATQETLDAVAATGEGLTEPMGPATTPLPPPRPAPYALSHPDARSVAAGGALPTVLTLVRRLCETLAHLHGEGIVHRDLKPDNVLVRPDGEPVLIDFGLVSRFAAAEGRESLDLAVDAMGTVGYVAPEQARGELADPRTDLYALGCILYELLTGRPPFLGESNQAVIWQHLSEAPAPPSRLADGVPAEVDEIVLRLLAKRPVDRIGHAEDVAEVLARAGAAAPAKERPRPRPFLYRPPFAGRSDTLEALRSHLPERIDAPLRLVLLRGESGAGKTRLLMELGAEARRRGMAVLAGGGEPPLLPGRQALTPLGPLRPLLLAIADRCREVGSGAARRLLGEHGRALAPYCAELAQAPGMAAGAEPADLPAPLARRRIVDALTDALAGLSLERPVVLLLDDVQWADDLTLAMLEHWASGKAATLPATVVAAYREEEVAEPLARFAASVPSVAVDRLPDEAVGRIVSGMLAMNPPPPGLAPAVARLAAGNPFFVAEYLQSALASGLFERREGAFVVHGDVSDLPLPTRIEELLRRRLASLSPAASALASVAAVMGRSVDDGALVRLADKGTEPLDALTELLAAGVLQSVEPGTCAFVHDMLRETLLGSLGEGRLRELHGRIASHLEAAEPTAPQDLAALGEHWMAAGKPARAAAPLRAAAAGYLGRHALREAERMHRAYLETCAPGSAAAVAGRLDLAVRVLEVAGRTEESFEEHRAALQDARALQDPRLVADALRGLGTLHRIRGQLDAAWQTTQEAYTLDRARGDSLAQALDLRHLAGIEGDRGGWQESGRLLERAAAMNRAAGDVRGEGLVLGDLGLVRQFEGRMDEARALYGKALAIHRRLGDRRFEGTVLLNLATLDHVQARLPEAAAQYAEARAIFREVGDRRNEASAVSNLGDLEAEVGRTAEARQLYAAAIALFEDVGEAKNRAIALGSLGTVLRERGELDAAKERLGHALALQEALRDPRGRASLLAARASVQLAQGDVEAARRDAEAALQALRESGGILMEGETLPVLARVLRDVDGDDGRAEELLKEAVPALRAVGDRLTAAKCAAERARLAAARGEDAGALRAEATAEAEALGMGERSRLGRRLSGYASADPERPAGRPPGS